MADTAGTSVIFRTSISIVTRYGVVRMLAALDGITDIICADAAVTTGIVVWRKDTDVVDTSIGRASNAVIAAAV